jgi:hypothetical protein
MRNDDTVFSAAITDRKLLERALLDTIESVGNYAIVGRSIPEAIARLDLLRQHFETSRERHT